MSSGPGPEAVFTEGKAASSSAIVKGLSTRVTFEDGKETASRVAGKMGAEKTAT